jgi:hypothetical protein
LAGGEAHAGSLSMAVTNRLRSIDGLLLR